MKRLLPALLAILVFSAPPALKAQIPQHLNYQGRIAVQGVNFDGTGQFKFALVGPPENQNAQATATPVIGGLGDGMGPRVLSIDVINGGSGYTTVPAVTITHPTGSGAAATAVLTNGVVTAINVTANGLGYNGGSTDTVVTIEPPPVNLQNPVYWSNAGDLLPGEVPPASVALAVTAGLYSVTLGDSSLAGMQIIPAAVFENPDVRLRVWFDDGMHGSQMLAPDQRIIMPPYASRAGKADSVDTAAITTIQIADNAVTADKISSAAVRLNSLAYSNAGGALAAKAGAGPTDAADDLPPGRPGQFLSQDGQGFLWVDAPGFSLPYSNTVTGPVNGPVAGPMFHIKTIGLLGYGIKGESLTGAGLYGESNSGSGVYGKSQSSTGAGVQGENLRGGDGVYGSSSTGVGVRGISLGTAVGVKGFSSANDGVVGETAGAGKSGVVGFASRSDNNAVAAINSGGTGVFAMTNAQTATAGFFWNTAGGDAIRTDGNVRVRGTATVRVLTIDNGIDIAEPFMMKKDEEFPRGSVMVISDEREGELQLSHRAYDTRVAGIISGANGINPGLQLTQEGYNDVGGQPVALTGRVYCRADASNGAIKPGDLLTTSTNPGHAMKATDHSRTQGAVLGKAMSALDEGTGFVLVLVTLQ